MSAEELLALAERAEKAEGPDRKLDYQIFCACVPVDTRAYWEPDNRVNFFTASLDAAMTLVPSRWGWSLKAFATGTQPFEYSAEVCERNTGLEKPIYSPGPAATPALALTAAALRARASLIGKDQHHGG